MTQSELELNATTWTTRSEVEEFDREDIQFHISQNCKISHRQSFISQNFTTFKLSVATCEKDVPESDEILFQVTNQQDTHIIIQPNRFTMYEVISSKLDAQYVELKVGDTYKFGKKKVSVLYVGMFVPKLELSSNYEVNSIDNFQMDLKKPINTETLLSEKLGSNELQYTPKCRFCLAQSRSSDNPVLNCCGCKGINNFLHLNCLKQWLKTKSVKGVHKAQMNFYIMKKVLQCQVCHKYFDFKYSLSLLLDVELKEYILLEDQEYLYMTYCREKECMAIGRSNSSYLQLSENTVSRHHAEIFYDGKKGKFYIRDLKSKFGTLKERRACRIKKQMTIQVGRNIFRLKRIAKLSLFSKLLKFCSREEINYEEDERKGRLLKK